MTGCEIQLVTPDGRFVAVVDFPAPFQRLPEIAIWGSRTFALAAEGREGVMPTYSEVFAVVSLTPSPGRPMPEPAPPAPVPPVDESARTVLGDAVGPGRPDTTDRGDGQQKGYVVLSAAERAKGFVRPVRSRYRHLKCGDVTTMGYALAETYARKPDFYSGTFCVTCKAHFPVGEDGEFVWADGDFVITTDAQRMIHNPGEQKVGT